MKAEAPGIVVQKVETDAQQAKVLHQIAALKNLPQPDSVGRQSVRWLNHAGQVNGKRDEHKKTPKSQGGHSEMPTNQHHAAPTHQPDAAKKRHRAPRRNPIRHQAPNQLVGKQMLRPQPQKNQAEQAAEQCVRGIG